MPIREGCFCPCSRTLGVGQFIYLVSWVLGKGSAYQVSNTWQQYQKGNLQQVRCLLLPMQNMAHNWRPCSQLQPYRQNTMWCQHRHLFVCCEVSHVCYCNEGRENHRRYPMYMRRTQTGPGKAKQTDHQKGCNCKKVNIVERVVLEVGHIYPIATNITELLVVVRLGPVHGLCNAYGTRGRKRNMR